MNFFAGRRFFPENRRQWPKEECARADKQQSAATPVICDMVRGGSLCLGRGVIKCQGSFLRRNQLCQVRADQPIRFVYLCLADFVLMEIENI